MRGLALAVLLTLGPLFRLFPYWIDLFCLAVVAYRLYGKREIRGWLLKFVSLGAAAAILLQYGTLFSRDAGLSLLALLVCLKLLELKDRRDGMLVLFLCYFLIMTWFFDSQSMPVATGMLALVAFLTANLFRINARIGIPTFGRSMKSAAFLMLQAAPLALVLFLLFPRIPGPIWALPRHSAEAKSGLSDTLSPGSIGNLALSDEVAFRVEFGSVMPDRAELYWRGPVLWDFDGRTWTRGSQAPTDTSLHAMGDFVQYDVMLEPSGKRWLFALDMPLSRPANSSITFDRQILASSPVKSRMHYSMTSSLKYETGLDEAQDNLVEALKIPDGADPKARALAQAWKGDSPDDIVRNAIRFYRTRHFVYTLSPPLLKPDGVDDFLFRTRSGFCEHYASSFAFLMRAAGVPARIVTGYQGGEINPFGHYLTVRQSDAHAWVEIWEKGRGWVRIDPTAIVAPMRIASGISAALPQTDALPVMMRRNAAWLRSIRFGWDAAADAWNRWVVGFGEERQKRLFDSLGMKDATLRDIAFVFATAISAVLLLVCAFLLVRIKQTGRDRVQEVYLRFCGKMKKAGLERRAPEGPLDYARRMAEIRPEWAPRTTELISLYILLRYGKGGSKEDFARFRRLVKSF